MRPFLCFSTRMPIKKRVADHLKHASLEAFLRTAKSLFLRFPLVVIDSVLLAVGTVAKLFLSSRPLLDADLNALTVDFLVRFVMVAALGMPLLAAARLFSEQHPGKSFWYKVVPVAAVLALLACYFLVLPTDSNDFAPVHGIQYVVWTACAYVLFLLSPFLSREGLVDSERWWQWGKTAFKRFCLSILFAGVLFVGLAFSLMAIQFLFQVRIDGIVFPQIWAVLASTLAPWIFLSGIPANFRVVSTPSYHPILRSFVLAILFPLIGLFTVILYAYLGKIVLSWDWPEGGVTRWILGMSIFGLGAFFLHYPMGTEQSRLRGVFRGFFLLLLPILAVFFMAFSIRLQAYGITANRLLMLAFGIWMTGMSVYITVRRSPVLSRVLLSAAILFFVLTVGPWSVFVLGRQAQTARLEALLDKNFLRTTAAAQAVVSEEECRQMLTAFSYLVEFHGVKSADPYIGPRQGWENSDPAAAFKERYELDCEPYDPYGGFLPSHY